MGKRRKRTWHRDQPEIPDGLSYEESGRVATITLQRRDRLNALTFAMYRGLRDLFGWLEHHGAIRAVILTGDGRGFCSGGDVRDIIGELVRMGRSELRKFTRLTCDVVENMRACPQPIVAALNGPVAGAGAALAVASDFRIATPGATIAFLFVKAGLSSADMGASHLLPRLIGLGRATEVLLLGEGLDAATAERFGLYNRVVAPEALQAEAFRLAERLAAGPGKGTEMSKATIDRQLTMTLTEALRHDAKVQAECMTSPDFEEAFKAFMEKRPAKFK